MRLTHGEVRKTAKDKGKGFGLLYEMGCGKSLTAIAIMGALFQKGMIHRVLIAAPGTVVPVWLDELRKFAAFEYQCSALLGDKKKRLRALAELTDSREGIAGSGKDALKIAAINYESTFRDGIYEALLDFAPDLVICDESQRIKNPKAQQSQALHDIADRAKYRLALSGTPIQQDAQDVYSQYRFLDKTVFGDNFYAFRARYCRLGGYGGKQVVGSKNEDELSARMYSIAHRVTKSEALDLPPETFMVRTVELSPKERKHYDEMRLQSVTELSNEQQVQATTVLTKLLRLQQIAGGFLRADDEERVTQIGSSKLDALADVIDDYVISEGRKLVIFSRFLPEIEAISKLLSEKNIRYGKITGAVGLEDRGRIVEAFQTDPEMLCFVAQTQTAGLGITLHAASAAVFYSVGYNLADYQQALARIHRKGQQHPCTYILLQAENTVDQKIMESLEKKNDIAKRICDNWQTYFT